VIGNQEQGPTFPDPVAHRVTLCVGDRGRIPLVGRASRIDYGQNIEAFKRSSGEWLLVRNYLIAIVGNEVPKWLVSSAGSVGVVVGFIE
jgi:hypothetical protein